MVETGLARSLWSFGGVATNQQDPGLRNKNGSQSGMSLLRPTIINNNDAVWRICLRQNRANSLNGKFRPILRRNDNVNLRRYVRLLIRKTGQS
jgi:hypothetical protein